MPKWKGENNICFRLRKKNVDDKLTKVFGKQREITRNYCLYGNWDEKYLKTDWKTIV